MTIFEELELEQSRAVKNLDMVFTNYRIWSRLLGVELEERRKHKYLRELKTLMESWAREAWGADTTCRFFGVEGLVFVENRRLKRKMVFLKGEERRWI